MIVAVTAAAMAEVVAAAAVAEVINYEPVFKDNLEFEVCLYNEPHFSLTFFA